MLSSRGLALRSIATLLLPLVVILSAVILSGCVSDLDISTPEQTLWEASLQGGLEQPGIFGNAAAISNSSRTEAGIQMTGLAPGTYAWRIREQSCNSPGAVVGGEGQYPDLVAEEPEGDEEPESVSGETAPFRATMQLDGSYHVEVREAVGDERVACGLFVRQ